MNDLEECRGNGEGASLGFGIRDSEFRVPQSLRPAGSGVGSLPRFIGAPARAGEAVKELSVPSGGGVSAMGFDGRRG